MSSRNSGRHGQQRDRSPVEPLSLDLPGGRHIEVVEIDRRGHAKIDRVSPEGVVSISEKTYRTVSAANEIARREAFELQLAYALDTDRPPRQSPKVIF